MAGYTPLFASLTTGTLCGKWPDIGLWPIILSMADKNGVNLVTACKPCNRAKRDKTPAEWMQ